MDTIVVYIENENKHFNLAKSLDMLNIPHHRLYEGGEWISLLDKLRIYIEGLSKLKNEWVILSDSRDVLFYKDLDTINTVYKNYYGNRDIIVQAEDCEIGDTLFRVKNIKRYSFGDGFYKYPCSGLIMGKRKIIIEFFKEALEKSPIEWQVNDQPVVEWGMKHLDYNIELDTECRLFQSMSMGVNSGVNYHLHFNKNFIRNTHTNTEPCIFHGAGKSFLGQVWKIIHKKY